MLLEHEKGPALQNLVETEGRSKQFVNDALTEFHSLAPSSPTQMVTLRSGRTTEAPQADTPMASPPSSPPPPTQPQSPPVGGLSLAAAAAQAGVLASTGYATPAGSLSPGPPSRVEWNERQQLELQLLNSNEEALRARHAHAGLQHEAAAAVQKLREEMAAQQAAAHAQLEQQRGQLQQESAERERQLQLEIVRRETQWRQEAAAGEAALKERLAEEVEEKERQLVEAAAAQVQTVK
jgi:hypothetical protein